MEKISFANGRLMVPDRPVIPFIEGDGTGPDIWRAAKAVIDHAVKACWAGWRRIAWKEVPAGGKAHRETGNRLPKKPWLIFETFWSASRAPCPPPVGKGIRCLNVALRQRLDLYACVRPVRHFPGVPSPVKTPYKVDMVVFRENTENVYAGLDLEEGKPETLQLIEHMGWIEAAERIENGLERTFVSKTVTYDLARLMDNSEEVSCSAFARLVCENMD